MKNMITRLTMLAALAAFVCVPAVAEEKSIIELKRELGVMTLNSVQRGVENEQLVGVIREKTKEILERNGIRLPDRSPEVVEYEKEYWQREQRNVKDRKGPPDWAPAHGWRRKFDREQETALGDYIVERVRRGQSGPELISVLQGEIEHVSKGGKVGDASKRKGSDERDGKRGLEPRKPGITRADPQESEATDEREDKRGIEPRKPGIKRGGPPKGRGKN